MHQSLKQREEAMEKQRQKEVEHHEKVKQDMEAELKKMKECYEMRLERKGMEQQKKQDMLEFLNELEAQKKEQMLRQTENAPTTTMKKIQEMEAKIGQAKKTDPKAAQARVQEDQTHKLLLEKVKQMSLKEVKPAETMQAKKDSLSEDESDKECEKPEEDVRCEVNFRQRE